MRLRVSVCVFMLWACVVEDLAGVSVNVLTFLRKRSVVVLSRRGE